MRARGRPVRLAHIWSSDMGIAGALPRVRAFVARGWDVYAICPDGPRLARVRAAGVRWLPLALSRSRVAPADAARAAVTIARYCRRFRFDIVHTHNIKAGMIGRVSARLAGRTRIVHTVHGLPFDVAGARGGHGALERFAARFADRVLVQSEDDHRALIAAGVASSRLVRIGNGVPFDRFHPEVSGDRIRGELGLARDDVLFVSAGRLVRGKGFVELAEATARARARNPRIHTVVVGPLDPGKREALTARELAVAERAGVRFLGERDDMPEVMATADVVVLASHHEGLPRSLIEGAAIGRPLLATACRGAPEVVGDGGVVVPVGDAGALAQAMIALADDPARRRSLGERNQRRARELYDLRTVAARIDAVYQELLGARCATRTSA